MTRGEPLREVGRVAGGSARAGGPARAPFPSRRRRAALGRELAIRARGEWAIEQRAWARAQIREQATRRLVSRAEMGAPYGALLRA